jgi:hypothetical protein
VVVDVVFADKNEELLGEPREDGASAGSYDTADLLRHLIDKLFVMATPALNNSKEAVENSMRAIETVEAVEKRARKAEKQVKAAALSVKATEERAESAAVAAERALPHILTVLSILLAAVIAIMCIYLSSIFANIDELEDYIELTVMRPSAYIKFRQHSFSQLLFLGQVTFNVVWFFVYLCSKLISGLRWRNDEEDNAVTREKFLSKNFKKAIILINVGFFIAYIVLLFFRVKIFG